MNYSRLYHVILRRRSYHFCAISYLISCFLLWLTMLDAPPALWNGLHLTLWIMSGANWASATIPLMTLRRIQLTARSLYAPNRYTRIWITLKSTEFITSSLFCLISSTLICLTYIATASALNENPDLSLIKKIPGRGVSQINERPIYLLASCWYTALCYSFLAVYRGRWKYHPLDVLDHLTIPQRIGASFGSRLKSIRRSVISFSITYVPIYLILRSYFIRAVIFSKYTQLTKHVKPHMIMLIKYESILTLTSTIRLVMLNTLIVSMWETVQVLWDVYSTHPLDLSRFDTEPNQCLLDGIKSTDPRVKHHAMHELAHVSWSDPARRATIFKDIRTSPKLLNLIINECLDIIESTKLSIQSRGQISQTPPATSSSTEKTLSGPRKPSPGTHSALKNDLPQVFKNPSSNTNSLKQVFLTKLLASDEDAPAASPTQTTSTGVSANGEKSNEYQIPQIFQRDVTQKVTSNTSPVVADPKPTTTTIPSIISTPPNVGQKREMEVPKIWKILLHNGFLNYANIGIRVERWLFSPLLNDELETSLCNRRLCILAVEVVTNFSCASLTEDQYGVLQDQIPRILETMVDTFQVLEGFQKEICTEFGLLINNNNDGDNLLPDSSRHVHLSCLDQFIHPLLTRFKTGILGILDQFKPFLSEIKLNQRVYKWIELNPPS